MSIYNIGGDTMSNKLYQDKKWLEEKVKELKHASLIAEECGVSHDAINYWIKKFGIEKYQYRRMSARTHTLDIDYFDEIDTEEKAYWLGFAMADGCITQTDKKYPANRFHFCLKNDNGELEHLRKFNSAINSDYEIKVRLVLNKKKDFESEICELRINSKPFVQNLQKHGISMNKTGFEHIPGSVPPHLKRHFIRGYYDGDGSLTKSKALRICSSSKRILEQINNAIESELGNEFAFKIYEVNTYKKPFYTIDSRNSKKNRAFLSWMYSDSSIYLDRKHLRFLEVCPSAK